MLLFSELPVAALRPYIKAPLKPKLWYPDFALFHLAPLFIAKNLTIELSYLDDIVKNRQYISNFRQFSKMKKSAQRVQDFQEIPAHNAIPDLLWFRVRNAPAETVYPQHAHAWGELFMRLVVYSKLILIKLII